MADYKVGNLQIVFDTLNQTDEGFKKLASNLRAVQKAIAKIGDTDLKPFVANIKQITKSFTPLLTNISGASEGIIALNQAIQKVGASKLSKVAQEFEKVNTVAEETTRDIGELTGKSREQNQVLQETSTALVSVSNAQNQVSVEFENLNRLLTYNSYDKVLASVGGLAKAWRNLYTTYSQMSGVADKLTGGMFSEEAANRLQSISQKYFQQKEIVEQTNRAFREMEEQYRRSKMTVEELTIEEYRNVEAKRKQRIEYLEAALALGKAGENTEAFREELARLREELDKNNKSVKNSIPWWKKLLKSIGRISLYRAIRRAIQLIANAFKESIGAFAEYDSQINQLMSQLKTSTTIIKYGLGTIALPILQSIAPVLQQISVGFANLGNVINASMAKMQGLATYTKINTDKLLEYGKASKGVLLDFDKFRSLGGQEDSILSEESIESLNEELGITSIKYEAIYEFIDSIGFLVSEILKTIRETFEVVGWFLTPIFKISSFIIKIVAGILQVLNNTGLIKPILGAILGYLIYISATKIIESLTSGKLNKIFTTLISKLDLTKIKLSDILTSTKMLAISFGALFASVMYFLSSLDEMGDTAKWVVPLVAGITAAVVGLTTALIAMYSAHLGIGAAVKAGISAAAITGAIALAVGTTVAKAQPMADGGIPSVGTLFYAGEAGAETVTVGSSGRTEVTNVQQMEQALYNALVRYGRESRGSDSAININIDGQKVFEATRRTANRRGLDFSRI